MRNRSIVRFLAIVKIQVDGDAFDGSNCAALRQIETIASCVISSAPDGSAPNLRQYDLIRGAKYRNSTSNAASSRSFAIFAIDSTNSDAFLRGSPCRISLATIMPSGLLRASVAPFGSSANRTANAISNISLAARSSPNFARLLAQFARLCEPPTTKLASLVVIAWSWPGILGELRHCPESSQACSLSPFPLRPCEPRGSTYSDEQP